MQLLIREGNRGWEHINTDPALYDAVTPEDIMRVANTYFTPESRAVAIYYRTEGEEAETDPLLAGLSDEEQQQVRQMRTMISQMDAQQLTQFLGQAEQMMGQAPPDARDAAQAMIAVIQQRLEELEGGQ